MGLRSVMIRPKLTPRPRPVLARTLSPAFAGGRPLERVPALLAHEAVAGLEPVTQEVEPLARVSAVADPRLVRVQREAVFRHPRLGLAECGHRLVFRPTQD